mgnify:CR=1 FL=1
MVANVYCCRMWVFFWGGRGVFLDGYLLAASLLDHTIKVYCTDRCARVCVWCVDRDVLVVCLFFSKSAQLQAVRRHPAHQQ